MLRDEGQDEAHPVWELRDEGLPVWGYRDGVPVCPDVGRAVGLRVSARRGEERDAAPVCPDAGRDEELPVWEHPDAVRVSVLRDVGQDEVHPVSGQNDDPDREAERLPLREAAGQPSCRR